MCQSDPIPIFSFYCTPILQSLARGGVSVSVTLEYRIVGSGEGKLCASCVAGPPKAQTCIGVSDGWPNNRVNLEAWYQLRRVKICRKKVWSVTIVSHILNSTVIQNPVVSKMD